MAGVAFLMLATMVRCLGANFSNTTNVINGSTNVFWIPNAYASSRAWPLIILHHGANGVLADWFTTPPSTSIDMMCTNSWIVCASDTGNNHVLWGNQTELDYYADLSNYAVTNYQITRIVHVGASMGGISALLQCSNHVGFAGVFPVCNLRAMFDGGYTAQIKAAYGIASDGSDYYSKTTNHDPVLIHGSLYASNRMRFYASYGDVTVLKTNNSDIMSNVVQGFAIENIVVERTGTHQDDSRWYPDDLLAFLQRCNPLNAAVLSGKLSIGGKFSVGQ